MITEILLSAILIFLLVSLSLLFLIGRKLYKMIIQFLPTGFSSSDSYHKPAAENTARQVGVFTSSWKYKLMLLKAYFDNGYSLTSYPKWALAILGIGSAIQGFSLFYLAGGAIAYGIICFFSGWIFLKWGFYEAQQEVSNQFNLFVKELRERKTI